MSLNIWTNVQIKCPKAACGAALKRQTGNHSSPEMKQTNRTWWIFILSSILMETNRLSLHSFHSVRLIKQELEVALVS